MNDAAHLGTCIASISIACPNVPIIVCDNGSDAENMNAIGRLLHRNPSVSLLKCSKAGAGYARQHIAKEYFAKLKIDFGMNVPRRLLAFTDADSIVPRGWISSILLKSAESPDAVAISGLHSVDETLEAMLAEASGIPRLFNAIADIGFSIFKNGIADVPTSGANSIFEASVLAQIGGDIYPQEPRDREIGGSDRFIGRKIKRAGLKIAFLDEVVVTSLRSQIQPLLEVKPNHCHRDNAFRSGLRERDDFYVREAMKNVDKRRWLRFKSRRLRSFLRNVFSEPLTDSQIAAMKGLGMQDRVIDTFRIGEQVELCSVVDGRLSAMRRHLGAISRSRSSE